MNILVTGGNSGIGRCIAEYLISKGHKVLGTSRNPASAKQDVVELIELDVTSKESIEKMLAYLKKRSFSIDVLVNNAGIAVSGSFEETTEELARKQIETNFWGAVSLTNEVLPYMRTRGSGKVIFISSLAGLIGVPYQSFYSASKHAVEGMAKSLRQEVREFGIHVSCVEPGFFKSNIHNNFKLAPESIPEYASSRSKALKTFSESVENAPEPRPVAKTVQKIINSKNPRPNYKVGKGVKFLAFLQLLSSRIFEMGVRRKFKLP